MRGSVSPSIFIPIAEESGLILKIGEWVLREACREAVGWMRPLNVAVNVSALQLSSDGFVELVLSILEETGLSSQRLEIEITETALVRDPNRALRLCGAEDARRPHRHGRFRHRLFVAVQPAGFSVRQDQDRQVLHSGRPHQAQAAAIVRAVLGLGRGLGLPVMAEGVETAEELNFLGLEGCTEAQGYLVGHPAPIYELSSLICDNIVALPKPLLRAVAERERVAQAPEAGRVPRRNRSFPPVLSRP